MQAELKDIKDIDWEGRVIADKIPTHDEYDLAVLRNSEQKSFVTVGQ